MQEQYIESLIQNLEEKVEKVSKKDLVRKEIEAVVASGKLLSLSEVEVKLLEAYRAWKGSPAAVTGAFHFKP